MNDLRIVSISEGFVDKSIFKISNLVSHLEDYPKFVILLYIHPPTLTAFLLYIFG